MTKKNIVSIGIGHRASASASSVHDEGKDRREHHRIKQTKYKSNILTVHDHDRYEKRPVYYICTICAQTFDFKRFRVFINENIFYI